MATKTIVRWKPSMPVYGSRVITVADFEREGIFTQRRDLVWDKERNFWLDGEKAEISAEALAWLVDNPDSFGTFTVEKQEIPDPAPPVSPQLLLLEDEDDSSTPV